MESGACQRRFFFMLDFFRQHAVFFMVSASALGLVVGSFLNVVIHRLPRMMEQDWFEEIDSQLKERAWPVPAGLGALLQARLQRFDLFMPRSACPACGHRISALENVPVLSYLALRGRCAGCGKRIALRYPLVEVATAGLSALVAWRFGPTLACVAALVLCWSLLVLALIDFDTQLLPDSITLPLVWAGIAFNLFDALTNLQSAVIGAMAGYLVLWSVYWLFKIITGREGMGFGDFKLLAALGAFLGWALLPLIVLLSSVVGAVIGILLILMAQRGREVPMPFGPYLACAGLVALLAGDHLTRAYLDFL